MELKGVGNKLTSERREKTEPISSSVQRALVWRKCLLAAHFDSVYQAYLWTCRNGFGESSVFIDLCPTLVGS